MIASSLFSPSLETTFFHSPSLRTGHNPSLTRQIQTHDTPFLHTHTHTQTEHDHHYLEKDDEKTEEVDTTKPTRA